jgi:hypothetical protein
MPTPEALAHQTIDQKLNTADWIVQEISLSTYFRHQSLAYIEQAREMVEGD